MGAWPRGRKWTGGRKCRVGAKTLGRKPRGRKDTWAQGHVGAVDGRAVIMLSYNYYFAFSFQLIQICLNNVYVSIIPNFVSFRLFMLYYNHVYNF